MSRWPPESLYKDEADVPVNNYQKPIGLDGEGQN